jgi:hypothetical protein
VPSPLDPDTNVGAIYRLMREDPRTAEILERLLNDGEYFERNPDDRSALPEAQRRALVAMARQPETRRVLVEAALDDLTVRSRSVEARLKEARETGTSGPAYDVVVVGAGIHDQILNNVLTKERPGLRVLTIEQSDSVASNFGGVPAGLTELPPGRSRAA